MTKNIENLVKKIKKNAGSGDLPRATSEHSKLVGLYPDESRNVKNEILEHYINVAENWSEEGNMALAGETYEAILNMNLVEEDKSNEIKKKVADNYIKDADKKFDKGMFWFAAKRYKRASKLLESDEARKYMKKSAETYVEAAEKSLEDNDPVNFPLDYYEEAHRLDPSNTRALKGAEKEYRAADQIEKANKMAEMYRKLDSRYDQD